MASTSWINKIIYKKGPQGQETTETFPIGVTFDKVFYAENYHFSLADVIENLKKFFSRQGFMLYSQTEPTINSKTMEWYALSGNSSDIDNTFEIADPYEETYN